MASGDVLQLSTGFEKEIKRQVLLLAVKPGPAPRPSAPKSQDCDRTLRTDWWPALAVQRLFDFPCSCTPFLLIVNDFRTVPSRGQTWSHALRSRTPSRSSSPRAFCAPSNARQGSAASHRCTGTAIHSMQGTLYYPGQKKNHPRDSRREEHCSRCDIMLDQTRSAQGKSRGQSRIGLARG